MKKIIIVALLFIMSISGVNAWKIGYDYKKDLDIDYWNKLETSIFFSWIRNEYNTDLFDIDEETNKITFFTEDKETLDKFTKEYPKLKSKIKELESNILENETIYLNKQISQESDISIFSVLITFIFFILLIAIITSKFSIEKKVWLSVFLILIMFMIWYNDSSNNKNNNYKEKKQVLTYWKYNKNSIFRKVVYFDNNTIQEANNFSDEELKSRIELEKYYDDFFLYDENGNPIKELTNKDRFIIKKDFINFYNKFKGINTDNIKINVYKTKYTLLIRVHEHPVKETLRNVAEIWIQLGVIYAKHKVSKALIWKQNFSNEGVHAFNNLTTLIMVSNISLSLLPDMEEIPLFEYEE